VSHTTLVSYT